MSAKIYENLLKDYPIDESETAQAYTRRIWDKLPEYGCKCTNFKTVSDTIRMHLPQDRTIKIKRSETTLHGVTQTERFGYIKEDEISDKDNFEAKKLTTNPYGGQWVKYEKKDIDYLEELKVIFKDFKFSKVPKIKQSKSQKALKITLADMHVGMSVTEKSLFGYKYNKKEFFKALDLVYESCIGEFISNGRFDLLIIQDLGDGLDGYNNQTTRGGHALEQDMDNKDAFKTYIDGKINLLNRLYVSNIANKIIVKNSVNCNHAGDFGYMANYAIKMYCDAVYKDIEYDILERFIDHWYYGEHCFIQSHGKDKKYMKSGMPVKLNPATETFINQYIERYGIKSKYIHFEKADQHQVAFDMRKKFDYSNFMSLAPPSNWSQHNFGDGYFGFSLQIIEKDKKMPTTKHTFIDYEVG